MYYSYYPFIPKIPNDNELPPTIFYILNSYCNGEDDDFLNENYVKPSELAKKGRGIIFDFYYPLSSNINKEMFETNILNKFIERRIGRETLTAFKIALNVKLNEIMPKYNKLFDATINWNIFNDGENYERTYNELRNDSGTSSNNSSSNSSNTSDRRYSNIPENQIQDVKDGTYLTEYNFDTDINNTSMNNSGTSQTNGGTNISETTKRSPADKFKLYKDMLEMQESIYTMIYKDLSVLFYALV